MRLKVAVLIMLVVASALAQSNQPNQKGMGHDDSALRPTFPKLPDANPEMVEIAIEDQWDRGNDMFGDKVLPRPNMHGKSVGERDAEREDGVRKLLADGRLRSGTDFWLAALIFQHSTKPEGILLAHVLASTAAVKGEPNGKWMAAASMDRYLWYIGQPQVFGTQFKRDAQDNWTMEPYARDTLSDAERATWCVVPFAEQEKFLRDMRQGKPVASTGVADCK